jgi:hypothetical protein
MIRTYRSAVLARVRVLLIVLAALTVAVPAAAAAVPPKFTLWSMANTVATPGQTIDYYVTPIDLSDPTSGEVDVRASFPAGMVVQSTTTALNQSGESFSCTDGNGTSPVADSSEVLCKATTPQTSNDPLAIVFTVAVAPNAAGTLTPVFHVSGGGAPDETIGDPTKVSHDAPGFGIDGFDAQLFSSADGRNAFTQAAGHPYSIDTEIDFNRGHDGTNSNFTGDWTPVEPVKDTTVDLPPGLVADPEAVPSCTYADMSHVRGSVPTGYPLCAPDSQVGLVWVTVGGGGGFNSVPLGPYPMYNLVAPPGSPGAVGFNFQGVPIVLKGKVRADGDYGLSVVSSDIPEALGVSGIRTQFWGAPTDPSHTFERMCPNSEGPWLSGPACASTSRPASFLRNSTSCSTTPVWNVSVDSWLHPGAWQTDKFAAHDLPGWPWARSDWGPPLRNTGCDLVPFRPSVSVQPTSNAPDSPTGLDLAITIPQDTLTSPASLAQADLRKTVVTLPQGMSVNPSSADGLGSCSAAQFGLKSGEPSECPDDSKIGTVEIDSPLLRDPVKGSVFLAAQGDNPFGSLLAMYIDAAADGAVIKLPGRIAADPQTGQLTTTFDNNPQLPFSRLRLSLKGGPRAPLATPAACGDYTITSKLTGWNGTVVDVSNPYNVDCTPGLGGFSPAIGAGTSTPLAGKYSPFSFTLTRSDGMPFLSQINTALPPGLLANIGSVPQCDPTPADAGVCPAASKIGTTSVLSGPGAQPLGLTGNVYLTGPYKDAPFGLSIAVPTAGQAGPLDLGTVVVRAGIYIDRTTTQVRVVSDPLPLILQGIPLRTRQVNVTIDRPNFISNPTNCTQSQVLGHITSAGVDDQGVPVVGPVNDQGEGFSQNEGKAVDLSVPFGIGGCRDLDYTPKLALALTGKGQTTDDKHPALTATLTQSDVNQANTQNAKVALPLSMALDPDNANGLCEPTAAAADNCPAKSIIGHATAVAPILKQPLTGPVYFVRGERTDAAGRVHKTLPKLYVPLTGENGIKVDLHASSEVSNDRLVTTFDKVPDAPVTSFKLNIDGGKHGILVVSDANLCTSNQVADADLNGQNGAEIPDAAVTMSTPCTLGISKTSHSSKALNVTISGLGAGKVAVTGKGLTKKTKTISDANVATVAAPISKTMRTSLAHGHNVKVNVKVSFTPKGTKKPKTATKTITIHGAKKIKKK